MISENKEKRFVEKRYKNTLAIIVVRIRHLDVLYFRYRNAIYVKLISDYNFPVSAANNVPEDEISFLLFRLRAVQTLAIFARYNYSRAPTFSRTLKCIRGIVLLRRFFYSSTQHR